MLLKPWPYNRIKEPCPADWGLGMTVCIAAICNWDGQSEALVTASDHAISTGDYSADNVAPKIEPVHPHWEAMIAADDITEAEPILNAVRFAIAKRPAAKTGLKQVKLAFSKAYRRCLSEKIESEILAPLNMNHSEFIKTGLKKLGAENFSGILNKVKAASFTCDFLVCGFGAQGEPHIFTMSGIGKTSVYDRVGFWAIGSGQNSALSSLFFHEYNRLRGPCAAIYHVCEAKFMAETAFGVGKIPTFVSIHHSGNRRAYVLEHSISDIRKSWKENGCPRVPDGILQHIGENCIEEYDQSACQNKPLKLL